MGKDLDKAFLEEISKIRAAEIFLGVAHVLKVDLFEDKMPRPFDAVLRDVIDAYAAASTLRRKELLTILRKANKTKGVDADANRAKDSKEKLRYENM